MRRELFLATTLLATGCAQETLGSGSFTNTCVPHESTYQLSEGDVLYIGVDDVSFGANQSQKYTDFTKAEVVSGKLVLDSREEEAVLNIGETSTKLKDPVELSLSEAELLGRLTEDETTVEFSTKLVQGIGEITLRWSCDQIDS